MHHVMETVKKYPDGWLVECDCGRTVVLSLTAMLDGDPGRIETVIEYGDETAAHSWSSAPNLRLTAVRAEERG